MHIVHYSVGGDVYFDAVRSYTKVDIFDAYYDKLKDIGTIHSIKSGYGRIKPKLYGKIKTGDEEWVQKRAAWLDRSAAWQTNCKTNPRINI